MKKLFPIAVIALAASVAFTSCKKKTTDPTGNYTCTCIFTLAGVTDTAAYTYTSVTKSVATTDCNTESSAFTSQGFTGSCTLK